MRQALKRLIITATSRWPVRTLICWRVKTHLAQLAITFDDGPHPTFTPKVLDILASHGVKATFFVLGREAERYPHLLERTVADGHEVGLHGYDHTHLDLPGQMNRTLSIVRGLGADSRTLRPPGGRLSGEIIAWSLQHQMSILMWSFDLRDSLRHEGKASSRQPFESLTAGDIVLAHDDNPVCVAELPELINVARRRGLTTVRVSELARG